MTTATADTVVSAFDEALLKDAGVNPAMVPDVPAPPRIPEHDPSAPFGRDEDGKPVAPHGFKANGIPRQKPGGHGRPRVEKPQVTTVAQTAPGSEKDYTGDLVSAGLNVWLAASMVQGGRLLGLPIPDLRPYACHFRAQLPQLAGAWNVAAQQNPTVRGYVEKLAGDGSATWALGVGVASVGFFMGCAQIARADSETRSQMAAVNDLALKAYVHEMVAAAGLADNATGEA